MRDFKTVRKVIFRVIGFFIVLGLVLSAFSIWLDPLRLGIMQVTNDRENYLLGILTEPKDSIDVVVMGDSESYTFYSPMEGWASNGITSYDAGQAGQRLPETYYSLKRIFKVQSPKLIVLETNMVYTRMGAVGEAGYAVTEMAYYYFPVFKYHQMWKHNYVDKPNFAKHYKGYEIRTDVIEYTGKSYFESDNGEHKIPVDSLIYLRKIQKLCKKNGAELLFVTAPSPKNHTRAKHNALKDYASKHDIPYFDMNEKTEDFGINWMTDSLDAGDHLNLTGAIKASRYFNQYLIENYDLPDHRGEDAYKTWDVCFQEYKNDCDKY